MAESEWHAEAFEANLERMLHHDIPAFIVRAIKNVQTRYNADFHRDSLLRAIDNLFPDNPAKYLVSFDLSSLEQRPKGVFHHDMTYSTVSNNIACTLPNIHTTLSGGGDVWAAFAGTNLDAVSACDNTVTGYDDIPDNPHVALLRWEVDPELVDQNVYVGRVAAGDSVIFCGDSGRYAPWHRFDTDPTLGVRSAALAEVVPKSSTKPISGYDLWQ